MALFVPSLRGGGAERVMLKLAEGFASQGARVDLLLAQAEGPYLKEVSPAVRIVDLKASRVLASLPPLAYYLRRERPWALISAVTHANIAALWAKALARAPTKVVVSEHNSVSQPADAKPTVQGSWFRWLMRRFYPWAAGVVAVSADLADDLAETVALDRRRIRVIYNPVVTPELLALAREPVAHPWFAPDESPVVLSAGRLTAPKDFPTLIHAFAHVVRDRPVRLMILGEGGDRLGLEALIRELGLTDRVAIPGFVDNPYPYMSRCAAFVLSSRSEGLPSVLIEALGCGCPVISTDCRTGPREILEDGRWGRLVPVGDAQALARAMGEVLDAPPGPVPPAALARFTPTHVVDQYRSVLQPGHGP